MPSLAITRFLPSYRRLRPALATVGGLWLTSCGLVLWLAPDAARQAASDWAHAQGRNLKVGAISVNPFWWSATLKDIQLTDRDGSPMFSAKAVSLEAKPSALLLGRWRLANLELDTPALTVARPAGGAWNWMQLLKDVSGPATKDKDTAPPKFQIDQLSLLNGRVEVKDNNEPGPAWRLNPVTLSLTDFSTLPVEGGYRLAVTLDDGAHFDWRGSVRLEPLSSSGTLRVDGLTVARTWPLASRYLKLAAPQGSINGYARYKLALTNTFSLDMPQFSATLNNLAVQAPGGASQFTLPKLELREGRFSLAKRRVAIGAIQLSDGKLSAKRSSNGELDWLAALPAAQPQTAPAAGEPWNIAIDKIALANWQLGLRDESFQTPLNLNAALPEAGLKLKQDKTGFALDGLHAALANLTLAGDTGTPPLKLAAAKFEPSTLLLDAQRFSPGKITLSGLELALNRDAKGKIDLLSLLTPRVPARPAAPKAPASAWTVHSPEVRLENAKLSWRDTSTAKPVAVDVTELQGDGHAQLDDTLALKLSGRIGSGTLASDLTLIPTSGSAEGTLSLDNLPLLPLAPYVLSGTTLRMAGGNLSSRLKLAFPADGAWQINGSANLAKLAVFEPKLREPLVGWRNLSAEGLQLRGGNPLSIKLSQARLESPKLRLILDKQRNLNLTHLFTPHSKATPASRGPGPNIEVRSVVMKNGELDFADQSLEPSFGTRIHGLSGVIQGLSSQPSRRGVVTLNGRVDSFGQAKVRGTLAPFAPTANTDILLTFRNIPMNTLNPYSMTFAGWRVDDGRLNLDLRYHLLNRELRGENRVVIQSIKLGEEITKPGVTRLPLKLAVALLEDSDGRIDLNLPVSGNLNDPQFSYGHLMWQAFTNVVQKVVTAPFRALASMFGSEGFDAVNFAPGQAAIEPPEQEKLAKLAQLMSKRPRLAITLAGSYDQQGEARALARARIDRAILTTAGLKPEADLPLPSPDLEDKATHSAIKSVYADRIGRLKLMGRLLNTGDNRERYQALRNELIAAEQGKLDHAQFTQLAQQRAKAAQHELLKAVPALAERIQLAEPQAAKVGSDGISLSIKLDSRNTAAPASAPSTP
jgi:uncharacterized protein involved in outer membrane biogenesis